MLEKKNEDIIEDLRAAIEYNDNNFNLEFTSISDGLVKVNTPSYTNRSTVTYDYVSNLINNANQNVTNIQRLSDLLYTINGQYKRIIDHFAHGSKYFTMLTPYDIKPASMENSLQLEKTYINAASWMEKFNPQHEFPRITKSLFLYGEFYGYKIEGGTNITLLELPREYCRLGGFVDEVGIVSFDFGYFNSDTEAKLAQFPTEFTDIYNSIQNNTAEELRDGTTGSWYSLSELSVAFSLTPSKRKGLPYFLGTFLDLVEVDAYKVMAKESAELDNYAILHLKSPWKKDAKTMKDTLVPMKYLKQFHSNASRNTPKKVGTAADMLEWELFRFGSSSGQSSTSQASSNVDSANKRIYDSSGVSNALFNDANSTDAGTKISNQSDIAILNSVNNMYELFMARELRAIINVNYNWKAKILDVTEYNHKEKLEMYKESATFGGSTFMFLAATGLSPMEQVRQMQWENQLGINDLLQPLSSSHTQTNSTTNAVTTQAGEEQEETTAVNNGGGTQNTEFSRKGMIDSE